MLAEVQKKYGRLDIVCCNAGVSSMAPFEKLTEKEWDFNVDVNMKGVFLCMQAVVPYLKRGGRIVNTCSMAAIKPDPTLAHYTASKFGVLGLTKAAAIGLAGNGITVNCVCPGWVKTPMQDREIVWEGAMRGGYPGHGETILTEETDGKDPVLWWSHGGKLRGESWKRMGFLLDILHWI